MGKITIDSKEVICIQSKAFELMIDKLVTYVKEAHGITENRWIDSESAMQLLGISSKSTLQSLRDNAQISYTRPLPKIILYDRMSILGYLEKHKF